MSALPHDVLARLKSLARLTQKSRRPWRSPGKDLSRVMEAYPAVEGIVDSQEQKTTVHTRGEGEPGRQVMRAA